MAESFSIKRERTTGATLLRLYLRGEHLPVATAYLKHSEDSKSIESVEFNWQSLGYVDRETAVTMVEGMAALILKVEEVGRS